MTNRKSTTSFPTCEKILDVNHLIKYVLLDCWDQIIQDTINDVIDQLLKIQTVVIRAQDGHAEFRLS